MCAYKLEAPTLREISELREPVLHDPNPLIEYELSLGATRAQCGVLFRTAWSNITHRFTREQRQVYARIYNAVRRQQGGVFFLNAPGGTGKSFLLSTLLMDIRARGRVALACATSGIAATMYPLGHTVHSAFKLPTDDATLATLRTLFGPSDRRAALLRAAKLVIIDEAVMLRKEYLDLINRTMQDLEKSPDSTFGGRCVFVLAGDFRQVLPIVRNGTRADQCASCLRYSDVWISGVVQQLTLTQNMRAVAAGSRSDADDITRFSEYVLSIGDGARPAGGAEVESVFGPGYVSIPADIAMSSGSTINDLLDWVYPNLRDHYPDRAWLMSRAVLCSRNDTADEVNRVMAGRIDWAPEHEISSYDSVAADDNASLYPTEFLNRVSKLRLPLWDASSQTVPQVGHACDVVAKPKPAARRLQRHAVYRQVGFTTVSDVRDIEQ